VGEEQAKVLFLQELITFVTEEEDVAVKSLAGGRNESQDDGKLTHQSLLMEKTIKISFKVLLSRISKVSLVCPPPSPGW
jgi:hypothetical protein